LHEEKKPGDVLKVPGDPLDDVADDARYGIYTFITSTEKPREVVLRETLAPIIETVQVAEGYSVKDKSKRREGAEHTAPRQAHKTVRTKPIDLSLDAIQERLQAWYEQHKTVND
jgi:hypothetical protein